MLIKTTNACGMGCSHCQEDSTIKGQHMTFEMFQMAIDCTLRLESLAWQMGCPRLILLSGGEPTDNPEIVRLIEYVFAQGMIPLLISHGLWLNDPVLKASILRPEWKNLFIQITNDVRYYPQAPPRVDDPRIGYVDSLTKLFPMGRLVRKKGPHALPMLGAPQSFNLRSLTRAMKDVRKALVALRARAATGQSGHCTPNISDVGDLLAGETRFCYKIGTVDSSVEEITQNLIDMQCNKCGLETNLTAPQKQAIGSRA